MEWISNWAETIIITVIIGTIIEMILPSGSSKKYIKVVIGVYILFTIISPVLSKMTGKSIAVSNLLDISQYINEVEEKEMTPVDMQKQSQDTIRKIYIANLTSDMKSKLQKKGYEVYSIDLIVGQEEDYPIQKVTLLLGKKEQGEENTSTANKINEIKIELGNFQTNTAEEKSEQEKSTLTTLEKESVKEYVSEIYEIDTDKIIIP